MFQISKKVANPSQLRRLLYNNGFRKRVIIIIIIIIRLNRLNTNFRERVSEIVGRGGGVGYEPINGERIAAKPSNNNSHNNNNNSNNSDNSDNNMQPTPLHISRWIEC